MIHTRIDWGWYYRKVNDPETDPEMFDIDDYPDPEPPDPTPEDPQYDY